MSNPNPNPQSTWVIAQEEGEALLARHEQYECICYCSYRLCHPVCFSRKSQEEWEALLARHEQQGAKYRQEREKYQKVN